VNATVDPRLGGVLAVSMTTDARAGGELVDLIPNRRFVFS
jgi:hypothetical protein